MGSRLSLLLAAACIFAVCGQGCSSGGVDPKNLTQQETQAPAAVKALPDSKLPMGGVFGKTPLGSGGPKAAGNK